MTYFIEDKVVSKETFQSYLGTSYYVPGIDAYVNTLDEATNPVLKRFPHQLGLGSISLVETIRGCDYDFQIQLIAQSSSLDEFLTSVENCVAQLDGKEDVVSITDIPIPKNMPVNTQKVNEYMKTLQRGERIPTIVVDENRRVIEGYDAIEAYRQLGEPEVTIMYRVHNPIKLDVVYFSQMWYKYKKFQESKRVLGEAQEDSSGDPEMDKLLKDVEAGKAGAVDKLQKRMSRQVVYAKGGYKDLRIDGDKWKEVLSSVGINYTDRKATAVNGKNYWAWQGDSIAVLSQYDPVVGESCNAMGQVKRDQEKELWLNRAGDVSFFGAVRVFKTTEKGLCANPQAYDTFKKAVDSKATAPINYLEVPTIPVIKSKEVAENKVLPVIEPKGGFKSWWAELRNDPKYGDWVKQVANLSQQYLGADIVSTFMAPVSLRLGYYKGQTAGQYVYKFATSKGLTWLNGKTDSEVRQALRA